MSVMNSNCRACGTLNLSTDTYCAACGERLSRAWSTGTQVLIGMAVIGAVILGNIAFAVWVQPKPARQPPGASVTVKAEPTTHDHLERAQGLLKTKDYKAVLHELTFIVKGAPEFAEAKQLEAAALKGIQAEKIEQAPKLRQTLRYEYQVLISTANPHLNFIDTKLTKVKGGYALWATHEYFSQFTFSIGGNGPLVSKWIDENHNTLSDAEIVRVGVMGRGSYAGSVWFDVR